MVDKKDSNERMQSLRESFSDLKVDVDQKFGDMNQRLTRSEEVADSRHSAVFRKIDDLAANSKPDLKGIFAVMISAISLIAMFVGSVGGIVVTNINQKLDYHIQITAEDARKERIKLRINSAVMIERVKNLTSLAERIDSTGSKVHWERSADIQHDLELEIKKLRDRQVRIIEDDNDG